ncbi:oligosaccharide flippase family protein [Tenacibaculum sp. M341]|uniref:oligosaccharide flippase family protein n=1 Tax=Tenacibaculum sp. M341 TaxID=2530339 RepID=UPI0014049587
MIKFIKNKVFLYTISRYLTYIIQFVNSLLIAKYLGVYYLGVWGFITLVLQYLMRFNFGISNATTAIASVNKSDEKYVSKIIGVSITLLLILSVLIILFFLVTTIYSIDIGTKYSFTKFIPYVIVIAILNHFNLFFSNIFRVYGKLVAVAFNQSVLPIGILITTFFYKGEDLLWALVYANLIAVFTAFLFFITTRPLSFLPKINWKLVKKIQIKATYLFIYNACFYFIIISTRTFVSEYYTIKEFGFFTFAFILANSVLLLFQSIAFLIYPKLLNRFSNNSNEQSIKLLNILRNAYVTVSHFSIHIIIFLYPFLITFFPEYESTKVVFSIIALTTVVYTNSFGYQGLIVAKEKEKQISFMALIGLVLNILLSYLLICFFDCSYEYVIISTMITYFVYIILITKYGRKLISVKYDLINTFRDVFPLKWMFPFVLSLLITIYNSKYNDWLYTLPIIVFVYFNYRGLREATGMVKKILKNPKVIDV